MAEPVADIYRLREENTALRNEVDRLKRLIEYDRTGLAKALGAIRGLLTSHWWLANPSEWGSYRWDERTEGAFRAEVLRCFEAVDKAAEEALRESGRRVRDAFNASMKGGA